MALEIDPETAHRRLLVSDDEHSVRGVQYTIAKPENPRRYDVAIAAVTKTGFTWGKPYWEVQVKGRSCFVVGVASQSAPRKGSLWYSPRNGFWTIQKNKGQHYVQTEPRSLLHLADQLDIIGILINFSKNEVSFYNAQTSALIYSFTGTNIAHKLYPFVAACGTDGPEEWPIELVDRSILARWISK